MARPTRSKVAVLAASVVALALVVGCSSDSDGADTSADETTTSAAETATTADDTTTTAATDDATGSPMDELDLPDDAELSEGDDGRVTATWTAESDVEAAAEDVTAILQDAGYRVFAETPRGEGVLISATDDDTTNASAIIEPADDGVDTDVSLELRPK